jgi:hypothetical protein
MLRPKVKRGRGSGALLRRGAPAAFLAAALALAGYAGGTRPAAQEPATAKQPAQATTKVQGVPPEKVAPAQPAPAVQGPRQAVREQAVIPTGPQPAVQVKGDAAFDFGEVWPSDALKHTFILTNEGKAELSILKIQPG